MGVIVWFISALVLWVMAAEAACRPRWEWMFTSLTVVGVGFFLRGCLELSRVW